MQNRAKEGSTKANMHTFQLASEDYGVQNNGAYSLAVANVVAQLPSGGANFKNPFTNTQGNNVSYEDRGDGNLATLATATSGITSYADSSQVTYNIRGYGKASQISLVLTAGQ
jgi:hypothetical protein